MNPDKNEATTVGTLIPQLMDLYPGAKILVVDDVSTDGTGQVASHSRARILCHQYSMGDGAATKHGASAATGDTFVFMEAGGQQRFYINAEVSNGGIAPLFNHPH